MSATWPPTGEGPNAAPEWLVWKKYFRTGARLRLDEAPTDEAGARAWFESHKAAGGPGVIALHAPDGRKVLEFENSRAGRLAAGCPRDEDMREHGSEPR